MIFLQEKQHDQSAEQQNEVLKKIGKLSQVFLIEIAPPFFLKDFHAAKIIIPCSGSRCQSR